MQREGFEGGSGPGEGRCGFDPGCLVYGSVKLDTGLDDGFTILLRADPEKREHRAVKGRGTVTEVSSTASERLDFVLHASDIDGRIAGASHRDRAGRDERADHYRKPQHQPCSDRQAQPARALWAMLWR